VPSIAENRLDPQKKTFHADEQEREEVQQLRQEYQKTAWDIDPAQMVFLDESGVHLGMTRLFGRALSGERAHGSRPKNRGKNITMISAISVKEVLATLTYEGGTDIFAFMTFITQMLVPVLWVGAILLMDNLNVHLDRQVKEAVETAGAKVIFLPKYSPDLSPIELLWSKIKEFLRSRKPRTREELDNAIADALNTVTKKDIVGWYSDCDAKTVLL
jgi:transposase